MNLHFSKYHGTGNDFIMVDSRKNSGLILSADNIAHLCNRHFGIGADGLIIIQESEKTDFRMEYYNADGLPGSMCGNGGRCTTAYAIKGGWVKEKCTFEASDGIHRSSVLSDGRIRLELRDVNHVNKLSGGGYFLDTGSPHKVIFTERLNNLDVYNQGRKLRYDKAYPEGCNVNFVELIPDGIKVRTYERGVEDETLSCGTGVTASAIAAFLESASISNVVRVQTRGGKLNVEFELDSSNNNFKDIFLTGPVTEVFEGRVEV